MECRVSSHGIVAVCPLRRSAFKEDTYQPLMLVLYASFAGISRRRWTSERKPQEAPEAGIKSFDVRCRVDESVVWTSKRIPLSRMTSISDTRPELESGTHAQDHGQSRRKAKTSAAAPDAARADIDGARPPKSGVALNASRCAANASTASRVHGLRSGGTRAAHDAAAAAAVVPGAPLAAIWLGAGSAILEASATAVEVLIEADTLLTGLSIPRDVAPAPEEAEPIVPAAAERAAAARLANAEEPVPKDKTLAGGAAADAVVPVALSPDAGAAAWRCNMSRCMRICASICCAMAAGDGDGAAALADETAAIVLSVAAAPTRLLPAGGGARTAPEDGPAAPEPAASFRLHEAADARSAAAVAGRALPLAA